MSDYGDPEGLYAYAGAADVSSAAASDAATSVGEEAARVAAFLIGPSTATVTTAITRGALTTGGHSDTYRELAHATRKLADAIERAKTFTAVKNDAASEWEATNAKSNHLANEYYNAVARHDDAAARHYDQKWLDLQPELQRWQDALSTAEQKEGQAKEALGGELARFKSFCRREATALNKSVNGVYALAERLVPPRVARVVGNVGAISPVWTPSLSDPEQHWKKGSVTWGQGGAILDPGGTMKPTDIFQGDVGDCYFLAALIAAGTADPNFYQDHFHVNGNGTVTVTLYVKGKPVKVTVTDTVPTDNGSDMGAHGVSGDWPALYEKAYAALTGSYGFIGDGAPVATGLATITGHAVSSGAPSQISLAQLENLKKSGEAVTIATKENGNDTNDHYGTLIGSHAYVVESVKPDGMVTLRNPWNPNDHPTLSWSQIQQQTDQVAWVSA